MTSLHLGKLTQILKSSNIQPDLASKVLSAVFSFNQDPFKFHAFIL